MPHDGNRPEKKPRAIELLYLLLMVAIMAMVFGSWLGHCWGRFQPDQP